MTKYYIVMSKKENVATIYFNFQKSVPPIRFRVCTHIQITPSKWQTVNKSITAWNKYAKSEEGKPIVEKLELMQQTISDLYAQGKIRSNADKHLSEEAVLNIVNAEAIQKKEEIARKRAEADRQRKIDEEEKKKHIIVFYQNFVEGIKSGTIRHGNNKLYTKTTIESWESFRKYLLGYCKPSDTFDDINKAYADKFCAYLEKCGLMPTTCNKYIICFRKLCNASVEYGINKNATSLKVWKEREVHEEDKKAEIYLTEEELDAIYHYPLEGLEEQARDLFFMGYLCCQRFSDYGDLSRENFQVTPSGTPIIKIRQKKTGNIVEIPIVDECINELCEKYDYNFPVISDRQINDILQQSMKRIAESCPSLLEKHVTVLTLQDKRKEAHFADLLKRKARGENLHKEGNRTLKNMQAYADLHNGQPLFERNAKGEVVKFKYELVSTHTARRSGVTNLYKSGLLDKRDMMAISGHQTEQIFEEYIKVSKSEHADRIAAKLRQGIATRVI